MVDRRGICIEGPAHHTIQGGAGITTSVVLMDRIVVPAVGEALRLDHTSHRGVKPLLPFAPEKGAVGVHRSNQLNISCVMVHQVPDLDRGLPEETSDLRDDLRTCIFEQIMTGIGDEKCLGLWQEILPLRQETLVEAEICSAPGEQHRMPV